MAKKSGLSLDRHKEIGEELRDIYQRLQHLTVEFSAAYPFSGDLGRPYHHLHKTLKALGHARSSAENNLFRDHPGQATTDIYYGGTKKRSDSEN